MRKDRRYISLNSERVMNQSKVASSAWILPAGEVKKIHGLKGLFSGDVNHLFLPEIFALLVSSNNVWEENSAW
jgi:hypothetical protein